MSNTLNNTKALLKIYEAARPDLVRAWCPHAGKAPKGPGCVANWLSHHAMKVSPITLPKQQHPLLEWCNYQDLRGLFAVFRAANGLPEKISIGEWNDCHTHAAVMAAIDTTIAFLKNQLAAEQQETPLPDVLRRTLETPTKQKVKEEAC